MSEGEGASTGSGPFEKLGEVLRDPKQRKAFWLDPEGTLAKIGVDPDEIPERVRDTLHDLSYEELRVLARVNASLDEAGVPSEHKAEIV
jgi:hypothetical protein